MASRSSLVGSALSNSLRWGLGASALCVGAWAGTARADEIETSAAPPAVHESWARRASRDLARPKAASTSSVAIVELPSIDAPGTPRQRPRRALSVPSDMPRNMLRSIGFEAEECSTRFRLPAKLKRDVEGGTSIQIQAHLGLACSF